MSQLTLSGVNYEKPANKENNSPAAPSNEEKNMLQVVESMLKHCSVASCVVIDADKNILYLHGRLGRYLDPAEGHFKSNLLEMARSERLRNVLINSLHQAETSKQKIQQNGISIETEGHKTLLDISVIPLPNLAAYKHAMLVIFEPTPAVVHKQAAPAVTHQAVNNDVFSLQKQLDDTRNDLQMTIKDLETSNEELKSSNEELQSTNEELQSTNEELETSKEELQSLNEESTTVNAELQSRIDELSQTNDDIKNLLNSTQIATLFLDTDLKIRRFTPQMTRIISLMPADINRPIEHVSACLDNVRLTVHAEHVLKTLEKIEMEVNDDQGQYYKMRVLPYRTSNNVIDGVVISFEDVSLLKSVEISLRKSEQRYKSLFDDCPVAVIEVNYASLLHYISSKELKDSKSISHFLENNPNAQNEILDQIKVLNLNKAAMVLFESNNKKTLLPKIPQFIARQDDYLLQLLTMIMEKKQHGITNTVINSVSDVKLSCTITTTIPSLEHELNYHNCIMTLVKRE